MTFDLNEAAKNLHDLQKVGEAMGLHDGPGLGSGALRELREQIVALRDRAQSGLDAHRGVAPEWAGGLKALNQVLRLPALSLSSPIEPAPVRMEQPLGRLREIASGAVSASVAKQIRECVNQIVDLRLYGEPQASSEIREALLALLPNCCYCDALPEAETCDLHKKLEALASSRQGAAKRVEG